jgi:signal transduction histidine kinase
MGRKLPKIPLRIILAGAFILQSVLGVGLAGYLALENGQNAVNVVASQLRNEITARIQQHLDDFTTTPEKITQQNAVLLKNETLNPTDQEAIALHFWEQIKIYTTVTSIYFGNSTGGIVNSGREGADGSLYRIITANFTSGPFYKQALNTKGEAGRVLYRQADFNATSRPWYQNAVAAGQAVWNEAYVLFTEQDIAIAHSQPVYNSAGDLIGVVSVDIFTSHLSNFLQSLQIGQTGESYIMERSGLLIASSTNELSTPLPTNTRPTQRRLATESTSPLIKESARYLESTFNSYTAIQQTEDLAFILNGKREFIQVTPYQKNGLDWLVVVVIPESDFMNQVEAHNRTTLFLLILALISSITLGLLAARWLVNPIQQLTKSTQSLAAGNWVNLPPTGWHREIDELTEAFNQMSLRLQKTLNSLMAEVAERKQAEAALSESHKQLEKTLLELKTIQNHIMQQERLATVGQLSAGIAHDFNNILTSILGYAGLLKRTEPLSESARENLETVILSAHRAAQLVRQILDFSRKPSHQFQQLNLAPFIKEVSKFLTRTIPENITFNLELTQKDCIIEGDPTQLQQLITNLVINAKDAMPNGGHIEIKLTTVSLTGKEKCRLCQMSLMGDWVRLSISDTGTGITSDVLGQMFEPFFTTKALGLGTGLGLAQVYELVTRHKAHLTAQTELKKGSTFCVYFPTVPSPAFSPTPHPNPLPKGANEMVLVVEDEQNVRKVAEFMLKHLNYQVMGTSNAQEALQIYQKLGQTVDLVLLDLVLPDMTGIQLFEKLSAQNPNIVGVAMSGYPLGPKKKELAAIGIYASFQKPIILEELATIIHTQLTANRPPLSPPKDIA